MQSISELRILADNANVDTSSLLSQQLSSCAIQPNKSVLPHWIVRCDESSRFHAFLNALPRSTLVVTQFELTLVHDGQTCIQSSSLTQSQLDKAIACIPYGSVFHLNGLISLAAQQVDISLTAKVSQFTPQVYSFLSPFADSFPQEPALKLRDELDLFYRDPSLSQSINEPFSRLAELLQSWTEDTAAKSPNLITKTTSIDETTIVLSLIHPVTSNLHIHVHATLPTYDQLHSPYLRFAPTSLAPCLVNLDDMFNTRKLLEWRKEISFKKSHGPKPCSLYDSFARYASLTFQTATLMFCTGISSLPFSRTMLCTRNRDSFTFRCFDRGPWVLTSFHVICGIHSGSIYGVPVLQSQSPCQMNGFTLEDIRLTIDLKDYATTSLQSPIRATIVDANNNTISACGSISATGYWRTTAPLGVDITVRGDPVDLIRLADVLWIRERNTSLPPVLTSSTEISHFLESALEQFSLYPMTKLPSSPAGVSESDKKLFESGCNLIHARYHLDTHRIENVSFKNICFEHKSRDRVWSLPVMVSSATFQKFFERGIVQIRLDPLLQYKQYSDCSKPPLVFTVLTLADFLHMICLEELVDTVPLSVRSSVKICSCSITLYMDSDDTRLFKWTAEAVCGPLKSDKIYVSHQLDTEGPQVAMTLPSWMTTMDAKPVTLMTVQSSRSAHIWLDSSSLVANCVDPSVQYVLCQYVDQATSSRSDSDSPLSTISAFVTEQPHFDSGFLVIHATRDSDTRTNSVPMFMSPPLPLSAAIPTACNHNQLVSLILGMQPVWFNCLDFLDLNSLVYGLVPALHSLDKTTVASTTSPKYFKRRLISEFGDVSSIELFDTEVLNVLLSRKVEQHAPAVEKYCVEYLAAIEYQCRINGFMLDVMHQAPERVLPQRSILLACKSLGDFSNNGVSTATPVTVRDFTATSVPRAMLSLLLCTPPWIQVLDSYSGNAFVFRREHGSEHVKQHLLKRSHAHGLPQLLAFLASSGSCGALLWCLYTGPLYVYENTYSSHLGIRVDVTAERRQTINQGSHSIPMHTHNPIRMINIPDSNDWPVVAQAIGCCNEGPLCIAAPNMHEFFEHYGINRMIVRMREYWKAKVLLIRRSLPDDKQGALSQIDHDRYYMISDEDTEDMENDPDYDFPAFLPKINQPSIVHNMTQMLFDQSYYDLEGSDEWTDEIEALTSTTSAYR